jgi:hypothetical protein
MANAFSDYRVWRRSHVDGGGWIETAHAVRARTDKEAQSKIRRLFNSAAFHSMALVAVRFGQSSTPDGAQK